MSTTAPSISFPLILHINTSKEWRGGEQQLFYLAQGLDQNKKAQLILGQPESPLEAKCKEAGLPFQALHMKGEWDWKAIQQIRRIAREKQAKLIHTHTAHAHTLALLAKRKILKIPLVVSRRVDFKPKSGFFSRWKYLNQEVNYFLSVSQSIQQILQDYGISPEKLITVYSGIDTKKFHKLPSGEHLKQEFGIKKEELVITNIAALVDHKDQETLLKSIALVESNVPFKVLIVGNGPLEKKLKNLSVDLKLQDKVVFTGFRSDILEILSITDIFTLTSKEEGLGTSVLDAMASAKCVVATKGGGIAEMLTEPDGAFLSRPKDIHSLSLHYKKLLENESLRQSMGQFNKNSVKRFSYTETVKKTLLIYYSLLGETFAQ